MQTALQQLTRCRFIVQGFVLTVQVYSHRVSALLACGMLVCRQACMYVYHGSQSLVCTSVINRLMCLC